MVKYMIAVIAASVITLTPVVADAQYYHRHGYHNHYRGYHAAPMYRAPAYRPYYGYRGGWHPYSGYGYRYYNGNNGAAIAGAILGLGAAIAIAPQFYAPRYYDPCWRTIGTPNGPMKYYVC
jgi:hypothetical protein